MFFCLQLFLVLLIHHYHFALETFSIHLWVIFVFAPWDRHNHLQIASIPSLLGGFSPNSSRQPNAVSISHDDLRRRRFDTQVDAILPHARQLPERSSCSLPFPKDSFSKCHALYFCSFVLQSLARGLPISSDLEPRQQESCVFCDPRPNGMRRINLHFPSSFDVAANRPDHPLHRLDRPLDNSIAL